MSAIRLARGFTRRDRIIKFAGCYHGHSDALLASAGSGLATLGIPSSPGVPTGTTGDTVVATVQRPRRDRRCGRALRRGPRGDHRRAGGGEHGRRAARARLPRGAARCSATRRARCSIFDEVITGFRVARGGAQERYGVLPGPDDPRQDRRRRPPGCGVRRPRGRDGAARAGRRRLPGGDALGEPARDRGRDLGAAAAARPGASTRSWSGRARGSRRGSPPFGRVQRVGAMATLFFARRGRSGTSRTRRRATPSATAPSSGTCSSAGSTSRRRQFECLFVSLAHGDEEIDRTVEAVGDFFRD